MRGEDILFEDGPHLCFTLTDTAECFNIALVFQLDLSFKLFGYWLDQEDLLVFHLAVIAELNPDLDLVFDLALWVSVLFVFLVFEVAA